MTAMALQKSLFVKGLLGALVFLHVVVLSPGDPFLNLEPFETCETCESDEQSFSSRNQSSRREKKLSKRLPEPARSSIPSSAGTELARLTSYKPFTTYNPIERISSVVLLI
jgi:hypothetical protein